jgi:hypothetical protein
VVVGPLSCTVVLAVLGGSAAHVGDHQLCHALMTRVLGSGSQRHRLRANLLDNVPPQPMLFAAHQTSKKQKPRIILRRL